MNWTGAESSRREGTGMDWIGADWFFTAHNGEEESGMDWIGWERRG